MGFGVMTAGAVMPAPLNEYDIADTGAVSYAVGDETSKSYVQYQSPKNPPYWRSRNQYGGLL